MKRYSFRLGDVLRIRRLQEDMARNSVLTARRAQDAAAALVAQRESRYNDLAAPALHQSRQQFLAWRQQAGHRADSVIVAHGQHRDAAASTTAALDGWRMAHNRVEALERLDGRRREEHLVDVRRDEDLHADETIVARLRAVERDRA